MNRHKLYSLTIIAAGVFALGLTACGQSSSSSSTASETAEITEALETTDDSKHRKN